MKRSSRHFVLLLVVVCSSPALAIACIICPNQGQPLAKEIHDAKLVVFGRITDARLGPDGIKGTSEFTVDTVLRGDRTNLKQGKLQLPIYVPAIPGVKHLIFLSMYLRGSSTLIEASSVRPIAW